MPARIDWNRTKYNKRGYESCNPRLRSTEYKYNKPKQYIKFSPGKPVAYGEKTEKALRLELIKLRSKKLHDQ
jgi:hypothetical protein